MGLLLKEALKSVCASNGWCYAIFWKIGQHNPQLLIWEECHYEPTPGSNLPHIPGIETSDMQLEDWERRWNPAENCAPKIGFQAGNSICLLINKMMTSSHVNIIGEGLVGRAAFTGNHQWILSQKYIGNVHPPEVLNDVHHQFLAGMQTIAVIPVLPHGVVQLGSSFSIMEDIGFVSEVQRLIFQLGFIPETLFTTNESLPEFGVPISIGTSASMHPFGSYNVTNSGFIDVNSCSAQRNSLLNSIPSLISPNQDGQKPSILGQALNASHPLTALHDTLSHSIIKPEIKPNDFIKDQQKNGFLWRSLDARSKVQVPLDNSGAESSNQLGVSVSSASDRQQLLLDNNTTRVFKNPNTSNSPILAHLRADGGLSHNIYTGSATTQLQADSMSNQIRQTSVSCSVTGLHGSSNVNFSGKSLAVSTQNNALSVLSDVVHEFRTENSSSCSLPTGSDHIQPLHKMDDQNDLPAREYQIENDLFEALKIPLACLDGSASLIDQAPCNNDFLKPCKQTDTPRSEDDIPRDKPAENPISRSDYCRDACGRAFIRDELFDVLGLDFKANLLKGSWNSLPDYAVDRKTNLAGAAPTSVILKGVRPEVNVVGGGACKSEMFSKADSDNLLDAVVSSANSAAKQNSDDNLSCRTTLTNISCSSAPSKSAGYGNGARPNDMNRNIFGLPKPLQKAEIIGSDTVLSGSPKDCAKNCNQSSSISGSQISSWIEQGQSYKCESSLSTGYSRRPEEISKSNRKRLKPGESPRPRPKDRQMIQDRVKELREIVPNGAKCSIDALLERTIKHMLFLQSVTKHADKLHQTEESKITSKEGGILLKDNSDGGATWAFEVGSQSMVCPIIVEDLNPPRQMLVEMLCEERGFFLEIADIIRGMGLTILKGVMEVRNDKIWARFAVEANRDITRMEIFVSLIGLLDQSVESIPMPANGLDKGNMMLHEAFHQVPPITATGRPFQ